MHRPVRVVTLGAVCEFPPGQEVVQFLGSLDNFGGLNSRWGVPFIPVANAWHHLNRQLPCSLDAVRAIRSSGF